MKKISVDSSILYGLVDVSENETGDYLSIDESDPKYCRISLFAKNEDEEISLKVTKTVSRPTTYRLKDQVSVEKFSSQDELLTSVLQIIAEHVKKYGTIKEIRFTGHGAPGLIGTTQELKSEDGDIPISLLLVNFAEVEKNLKIKIADRIVFDACRTYSGLSDNDIKYASEYAKEHGVQLVGTTSKTGTLPILGTYIRGGRYVQFSPNGKIIWDKLDSPYKAEFLGLENEAGWTDFYIGHTSEEGMQIKKTYEQQKNDSKPLNRFPKKEISR